MAGLHDEYEPLEHVSDEPHTDSVAGAAHGVCDDEATGDRPRLSLVVNGFEEMFDSIEEQWQERALCAQTDPEAFFPEKGGSTREAKRICLGCDVRDECLEYALAHDERFGIWGGLSERERRRLKRGIV
jgi:WhiB family transcriptional regulator, redox-sensing transcriptional regulator